MNPLSLIAPALDAISGVTSAKNARDAFKHRYQDTVADMKAAGLNPALAYGQGGGNPSTQPLPDLGTSAARAVGTAASAKQAGAAAGAAEAQKGLTIAQTDLLKAQTTDLIQKIKLENRQIGAETGLTGARQTGQELTNIGTQTQNQILELDRQLRANERDYANATLADRITRLHSEMQKAGKDVTARQLENALLRAQLPKAQLLGDAATGAKDFINRARNQSPGDTFRNQLGGIQDDMNKFRHWLNQRNKK